MTNIVGFHSYAVSEEIKFTETENRRELGERGKAELLFDGTESSHMRQKHVKGKSLVIHYNKKSEPKHISRKQRGNPQSWGQYLQITQLITL